MDPNQVTDTSGITEGDGHFLHDYPEIMENPAAKNSLATYENEQAAMMGCVEARKLVGKPHINIPADDADDATKAKFTADIAKHTGAIESVEAVKIQRPDGADETNYNFALEKAFTEMVVAERMNQSQVDASYKMALQMIDAVSAKADSDDKGARDAAKVKLTSDWGGEANYNTNMELNTRCFEAFFDGDTAKMIEEKGIGNHVGFARGINELAQMAVKEGRTMKASAHTKQKSGGALRYPKMEARAKENA